MNTFTDFNLDSNIYKAITACGYTIPTPVQAKSIPLVMGRQDVVVSAQTGTGKTASFVLPALHHLSSMQAGKKTRILILTPTRELASQITKAARTYGKFMRFNIVSLVGGMSYHHQIKDLDRGADIIVATPGRLMDHIDQKRVDLSQIDMLVLDEADRMLDMGFIDDVQYIAKLTPSSRQTLLFSATLDNKLMNAVKHLLKNPVRIDLSQQKITSPQIKQEMYRVNNGYQKSRLLKQFLRDQNIFKAIIFSATKIGADRIADELCDDGFSAAPLHGDLRQNVRNRTLEKLRLGKIQYLVATDVAARGIDVSDITHVFNYDLPRFCEDYVHRIGRTGRAGKTGIAISFVSPTDTRHLQNIERYTGQRIQLMQYQEDETGSGRISSQEILTLNKHQDSDNERSGKSFKKNRSEFKSERSFRSDRDERPARTERKESTRRFDRDEKPARFERKEGFRSDKNEGSRHFDRDKKPARFEKKEGFRSDKNENSRHSDRDEKPARFERKEGFRSDKNEKRSRPDSRDSFSKKKNFSATKSEYSSSEKKHDRVSKKDGNRPFKKRSINKFSEK